jgi:hypothetical protein
VSTLSSYGVDRAESVKLYDRFKELLSAAANNVNKPVRDLTSAPQNVYEEKSVIQHYRMAGDHNLPIDGLIN